MKKKLIIIGALVAVVAVALIGCRLFVFKYHFTRVVAVFYLRQCAFGGTHAARLDQKLFHHLLGTVADTDVARAVEWPRFTARLDQSLTRGIDRRGTR
mgnify:CR=1 FL=1